jgi:hypothetical protein
MNGKQYWPVLVVGILAGFVGGAIASWLFTNQPVFAEKKARTVKIIEAEEFRLLDGKGRIRAKLELNPKTGGKPSLRFLDSAGRLRCLLGLGVQDEPTLGMLEETGELSLSLGKMGEETNLVLYGHKDRALMLRIREGVALLDLYDESSRIMVSFAKGKPFVLLSGWKKNTREIENPRVMLGLADDDTPALTLIDKSGGVKNMIP